MLSPSDMTSPIVDSAYIFEKFVDRTANVPGELKQFVSELHHLNERLQVHHSKSRTGQKTLFRKHASFSISEIEELVERIRNHFHQTEKLQAERLELCIKTMIMLQRHLARIDADIEKAVKQDLMKKFPIHAADENLPPKAAVSIEEVERHSQKVHGMFGDNFDKIPPEFLGMGGVPQQIHNEPRSSKEKKKALKVETTEPEDNDNNKQLYCYCLQPSHGSMVACNAEDCGREWFHWDCVGLRNSPPSGWICPMCTWKLAMKE